MPQLIPFYFIHLLTFGIISLILIISFVSLIILPNILRLMIARLVITKL